MSASSPLLPPTAAKRSASVRMTPVLAGTTTGYLLGPLAVRPSHKNLGIGRELVRIALAGRRENPEVRWFCWLAILPIMRHSVLQTDQARRFDECRGHLMRTGFLQPVSAVIDALALER
jgi:GNAT superfamily N-acetyltransferase